MAHHVVPHHHGAEMPAEHHHDMGHNADEDGDDEGFAFVFAGIAHNPASEKVIHFHSISEQNLPGLSEKYERSSYLDLDRSGVN